MEYSSYGKAVFTITGRSNIQLLNPDFLTYPTLKQIFITNFMKVLIEFYLFTNIYDLKFRDNETTAILIFL